MAFKKRILALALTPTLFLHGCGAGTSQSDESEYAFIAGELMAAIIQSMDAGGIEILKMPALDSASQAILGGSPFSSPVAKSAQGTCASVAVSACEVVAGYGTSKRELNDCTYNGFTFLGDIDFKFSAADCVLENGESVNRTPNLSITGRRGYTLSNYGTAPAQTLTKTINDYTFTSNELTYSFTDTEGDVVLEFSGRTTEAVMLHVGSSTTTISDGKIELNNETAGESCTLIPEDVTWDNSCVCPISGEWSGTCTNGTLSLEFSGCGAVSMDYDGTSETVNLDRCF